MNGGEMAMGIKLDDVAHIIQVALTPVFLLTGIASLLNVVNMRLGRVADQFDLLQERLVAAGGLASGSREAAALRCRVLRVRHRLRALDAARAFGALAGMCICGATFALFLGALQNAAVATALFGLFGASVLFTIAALGGFLVEVVLSSRRPLAAPLPVPIQDDD